ncbi:MAG: ammonia-forming cytochrome c nitrite reductase subunit c552 [Candidatus Methanoperedens sp.]|nr:ammonia-forming cytochrome c nitrite reductase subunit c552 [Candidatus Methanoperedens sp.]
MKKRFVLGIGILILLLALAGTGSAKSAYSGADCGVCHVSIVGGDYTLTSDGSYFRDVHKFNGNTVPSSASSCLTCHPDMTSFLPLTSVGSSYNQTHRYNATTLAAKMLPVPGCANCHVNAVANNFSFITGTPTYLTSSVCQDCHKPKYDNWTNTLHRVMLTPKDKAQAMGLPTPPGGWAGISYVVVSKFAFAYINTTGYFLATNDTYNTETEEFENGHAGAAYGTCGRCHTTGWDTSSKLLPGFAGTFAEPGIGCERCHKPGGNGHQVVVNYSGTLCTECHTGGNHGTGWENSEHAPPPYEIGSSCMFCHSSFDQYKNQNASFANATGVSCGVCHNIHDMTDSKYAATFSQGTFNPTTWSKVADSKLAFFNATASLAAGTDVFDNLSTITSLYPGTISDRKDASYGTAPINLTGRPVSEVLCSECHYRHGIAHIAGVNLTHGAPSRKATCTDCHMSGYNAAVGKDLMKNHAMDPLTPTSCKCHSSVPALIKEWNRSVHNDKVVGLSGGANHFFGTLNKTTGVASAQPNSCLKCKDPMNWNPAIAENVTTKVNLTDSFKGITCAVCHNIHDMGDWLAKTKAMFGASKPYAWYNKDAILTGTRFKANYTIEESTTELCGNCHSNIRYGSTGPGWASATATSPIKPHGFPAKDLFVGSWKETGLLKFECVDCHFAKMSRDANGTSLPADKRVVGHSFKVNTTILMNGTKCSSCHVTGSELGNLSTTIEDVQDETHAKWNSTNAIVSGALANYNAYNGTKNFSRTLIAQAYWNVQWVSSDESWGVHNPSKVNDLLDQAVALAISSNQSLGMAGSSNVQLYKGWNLVSLNATPASTSPISVMSSVSGNLNIVWGLNAATQTWVMYNPARPADMNTLTSMVKGVSYEIKVANNCIWTV